MEPSPVMFTTQPEHPLYWWMTGHTDLYKGSLLSTPRPKSFCRQRTQKVSKQAVACPHRNKKPFTFDIHPLVIPCFSCTKCWIIVGYCRGWRWLCVLLRKPCAWLLFKWNCLRKNEAYIEDETIRGNSTVADMSTFKALNRQFIKEMRVSMHQPFFLICCQSIETWENARNSPSY